MAERITPKGGSGTAPSRSGVRPEDIEIRYHKDGKRVVAVVVPGLLRLRHLDGGIFLLRIHGQKDLVITLQSAKSIRALAKWEDEDG